MLYIIDEKGKGHGALAEFGVTHGVNGEKSISGTIYTNDEVIHGIDRGWQLRFEGETYAFIYAKPVDLGDVVQVEFDAVHSFFYDFSKGAVNEQLKDGSHTMQAYLDFIFKNSGYSFRLDTQVSAFEKQSFGYKNRLALFNDVISSAGVEFSVNGSVVRIIDRVGNDLSTVVRKGFNLNDLTIEKNIGDFVTAQKGFGAWNDEEDHSKGRLEVEYISPLEDIYGRLDADPVVDERYTNANSLKARLENNVEGSYSISVALDMADLTKAGYEYKQPQEGDYIMAINEDLGFKRKIRIVSYTSKYDTSGELIDHSITANSLGMVQEAISGQAKVQNSINELKDEIAQTRREVTEVRVSADGKTNNYWSNTAPNPQEYKLNIGDTWYDTSGEDVIIKAWNGLEWRRVSFDKTAFERQFAEIEKQTQEMTASIAEADNNSKKALDKVNVNTDLLGEHRNILASLNGQLAEDLVTPQTVTNHKTWLTNYGELVANNGYDTTDYLPVSKGDLLSLESTVSHYYKLAFYDNDKNNLGYYDGSKVVLTPNGTAYFGNTSTFNAPADGFIRLSYSTATGGADTVKLSNQNNLYTLINSGYSNALSALKNVNRAMQEFGENLISLESLNRGYWLNAQGALMENVAYKTSDYISVDASEKYKLTGGYAVYQVYFYDINRNAIAYYDGVGIKVDIGSGLKYFTATPNVEIIMPSNASYVRIASSIADFSQISFRKLSTVIANMLNAVESMEKRVEDDLTAVRNTANNAFDKANQNGGKLVAVEQTVDDLKGEIINKVTGADVSTALNQFNETVKTQTATQITESLTGYAKSDEAESYAKTYAESEAGKIRRELTSYAKTNDLTVLAQNIRTETAESLKSVYTKTETNGLLGDKVSQTTYESGIKGVRESVTTLEGSIKDLSSARNLLKQSWHNSEDSPAIINTNYGIKSWDLEKPLELGKTYTFRLFGYTNREMLRLFTPNGMKVFVNSMSHTSSNIIRRDNPYNGLKGRFVWENSFTITQELLDNMTENRINLYNHPSTSGTKNGEVYWATLVEGTVGIDWQPAISDMVGQSEFSLFKRDYEATDKIVKERLTAVESTTKGHTTSINDVKKTADGNEALIAKIQETPTSYLADYQKLIDRANLFDRTLGTTDKDVGENVSRMVQTSGIIQTEVASMPFGGRNYLLNTETEKRLTEYGVGWELSSNKLDLNNREVTVTFYAKHKIGSNPVNLHAYYRTTDGKNLGFSYADKNTTTEWQFFSITIDKDKIPNDLTNYNEVWIRKNDNSNSVQIRNMMLTSGNVGLDWTPAVEDTNSKITQLSDNINLKVSKGDISNQININTQGVVIQGHKISLSGQTSVDGAFWAKQVNAIKVNADNITTGQLDGSRIRANSIDVNSLAGNRATLISAGLISSSGGSLELNGDQILSTASDGSQTYIQKGITGTRAPSSAGGGTIGQIGYAYESASPWYSMQVSNGSHFQIRMSRGDGQLNKQAFYIISGGTESYINTDNIYFNPSSTGRVRVQGNLNVDSTMRVEGTTLIRSRLEFLNGGSIESQAASSNMVIGASNKMIIYTNGTNALEFDAASAVFRRKISENSDIRLKTNIVDMPINSLEAIRNIEIKKFDYLDGRKNYYGIIAQQAQQYLPELINTDSEGHLMVDKSAMTYVNMHAIQQLDKKVNTKVIELEQKIASLQEELALLKGA